MIHEYQFELKELTIDRIHLSELLGFSGGMLPEPFDAYVEEAFQLAERNCRISGAFHFAQKSEFSTVKSNLIVDGIEFGTGRIVAKELRNAQSVVLFICTAGEGISLLSQKMLKGENPVLGYVLDLLGSLIVEAAMDELQEKIKQMAHEKGWLITNRYSPGYCNWSVADQHLLFSFFPSNCCGITLTDSSLMFPVKSVSGIIGIGKEVKFRQYTCEVCSLLDCIHKTHKKVI